MTTRGTIGLGLLFTLAVLTAGVFGSQAAATTTSFASGGHFGLVLENETDPSDSVILYLGNLHNDTPITVNVETDRAAGTATITGSGIAQIFAADAFQTGAGPTLPDEIAGEFSISYTGLEFGTDPVTSEPVIAIGREGSAATATLTLDSPLVGGLVTLDLVSGERFDERQFDNHNVWGVFAQAPFSLFYGDVPGDRIFDDVGPGSLSGWLLTDQTLSIDGVSFSVLRGDIQVQTPEPSTVVLAATGLLGLARSRRRR